MSNANPSTAKLIPNTDQSTRTVRKAREGKSLAQSIKSLTHTNTSERTDVQDPNLGLLENTEDVFKKTDDNVLRARQESNKQILNRVAEQKDKAEAYAKEQYKQASHAAQAAAAYVIAKIKPDSLNFLKKNKNSQADSNSKAAEDSGSFSKQLAQITEDPEQIPFIMRDQLSAKFAEEKKQAIENNDEDKLKEIEAQESQLAPFFSALDALDDNGSFAELYNALESMPASLKDPQLNQLMNSLTDKLGKIAHAQKRFVGITQEIEQAFRAQTGVDSKIDRGEFKRVYARIGGEIADRNGGGINMGHTYYYNDDEVTSPVVPFELWPDESGLSQASFPVQRLLWNSIAHATNRTYTGVGLDEDNPVPGYVYVDSEVPIFGDLPFDNVS